MDNTAGATLFAITIANLPPIERVPTIVNLKFLPDMGRMSGELPWAAETGSTWAVRKQDLKSPPSSAPSKVAAGWACRFANTSPTSCPASLTAPSSPWPNSPPLPTPQNRPCSLLASPASPQPCSYPNAYVRLMASSRPPDLQCIRGSTSCRSFRQIRIHRRRNLV